MLKLTLKKIEMSLKVWDVTMVHAESLGFIYGFKTSKLINYTVKLNHFCGGHMICNHNWKKQKTFQKQFPGDSR